MRQTEGINQARKDKHLNWEERTQIETLQREGLSKAQIGKRLGRPARTIHREFRRGWVLHRTGKYTVQERYSADRGQRRMGGRTEVKPMDERLAVYLRSRIIKHKESPEAVAARMKKKHLEYAVCAKTIYNLIDRGLVPGVTNESLWEKRQRNKSRKSLCRQRKRAVDPGHGISDRIIRCFIPKGCDISKYTRKQIQAIEDWINNYPRKILDFETAEERFIQELAA